MFAQAPLPMASVDVGGKVRIANRAFLELLGEELAVFEADEFGPVVAEGVFGFQVQVGLEADLLAVDRLLDLGQQVVAAEEEFDGLLQSRDNVVPVKFVVYKNGNSHRLFYYEGNHRIEARREYAKPEDIIARYQKQFSKLDTLLGE